MDSFIKLYGNPLSVKYEHINSGFFWDCFCKFQLLKSASVLILLIPVKILQKIAFESERPISKSRLISAKTK